MQKTKIRKSVSVEDDAENSNVEQSWRDEPERVNRPKYVSGLGAWWEMVALLIGGGALASIVFHREVGWFESDFLVATAILLVSIAISIIVGRFEGPESAARRWSGIVCVVISGTVIAASFLLRSTGAFSWLVALGLGLLVIGWSLRRLRGESVPRCVSLGLALMIPWITITGGLLPLLSLDAIRDSTNQLSFWFAGIMADIASMSFTPLEHGIGFPDGEIVSGSAFQNFSRIMVAIAISLGTSVILRQSFIVTFLCVCLSFMWWMVMRGWTCVSIASQGDFESHLVDQGMSILYLIGLALMIIGTNVGLGALISPIPVELHQYEVSSMTVIYNAMVSFPQLGPASVGMLPDDLRQSLIEKTSEVAEEETEDEGR